MAVTAVQVLSMKLGSCERAVSALHCRTVSPFPTPSFDFFFFFEAEFFSEV